MNCSSGIRRAKSCSRATTSTDRFPTCTRFVAPQIAALDCGPRASARWPIMAPCLVGGHTNPILGADQVKQVLTDYRDAVQFIHDKTVEGINKGLTPDELVEYVQLPEELAGKDYLQPFYGHPDWGVRQTFNYYLGWFDGNPSNLFPLPPKAEAERMRNWPAEKTSCCKPPKTHSPTTTISGPHNLPTNC